MHARYLLIAAAAFGLAAPAWADGPGLVPGPGPGPGQTQAPVLTLSATGEVQAVPDRITAEFSIASSAPTAAGAQRALNAMAATAMGAARAAAGITPTTGGYSVYRDGGAKPPVYRASQELTLATQADSGGAAPEAFLALVGKLQDEGLELRQLAGDLSPQGRKGAEEKATDAAIATLRSQAAHYAADLGMKIGAVRRIAAGDAAPPPFPRVLPMMAMAKAAGAPPQEASGPVTVSATVSGVFALAPQ